jgi:DNA polymerase-3 subunit alpha
MSLVERAMQGAEQRARAAAAGQVDLFGGASAVPAADPAEAAAWRAACDGDEWSRQQLLGWEKETLGLYLSGHPMDRYARELGGLVGGRLSELKPGRRSVAGLIVALRFMKGRRGRMAILTLDDGTARVEATVYNEVLEATLDKLVEDRVVIIEGDCRIDEFSGEHALNAQKISTPDELRQLRARGLVLTVEAADFDGLVPFLHSILADFLPGPCAVAVEYRVAGAAARVRLADEWRVKATDRLLESLAVRLGDDAVRVEYQ